MKYIKIFDVYNANFPKDFDDMSIDELLTKAAEKGWLSKKECTIREDGFVDVVGNVDMSNFSLTEIPIQFGSVSGDFKVNYNRLTTLKGSPYYVGGSFQCYNNQLITLDGCPRNVERYDCSDNLLTTMVGSPIVRRSIKCSNNKLTNTIGLPNDVMVIFFSNNNFPNVKYLNSDLVKFKIILKYQEEYGIWNSDGTLNKARYDMLVSDHQNNIID